MHELHHILLCALGIFLVGFSKAGFGGGLGMLTTPLCVIAMTAEGKTPVFALGVVLPLLCAADAFSLYHYWKKWDARNLKFLLPGVFIGVIAGVFLIGNFSPRQINVTIGVIAIVFVLFQFVKEKIFAAEGTFAPNHAIGLPAGITAGLTSTFANGAGPVIAMFLIPQRLPKEIFVGTNALLFTWINWVKFAAFVPMKIISLDTLKVSAAFLVFVPLGIWVGVWCNKLVSEKLFVRLVYLFTFLTGVQLLLK